MKTIIATLFISALAFAQESQPQYTIRWFGQSFFQIELPNGKKIVTDPHAIPAFGRPMLSADILLISHEHDDHNQAVVLESKPAREFRGLKVAKGRSAEWNTIDEKVGQIRIRSVGTFHDAESGMTRGKNAIFIVEYDGFKIVHLGDLGHELSEDQVKAIGPVDVLMIPIGGVYTINGEQARKTMEKLKPRLYVVPMHYGVPGYSDLMPSDEFLEGQTKIKKLPLTNEFSFPANEKADAPAVVLLGWQKPAGGPPKK